MNEYEEKYKLFGLTDEMIKSFMNYSVTIDNILTRSDSFAIKTIVIGSVETNSENLENSNAKLV